MQDITAKQIQEAISNPLFLEGETLTNQEINNKYEMDKCLIEMENLFRKLHLDNSQEFNKHYEEALYAVKKAIYINSNDRAERQQAYMDFSWLKLMEEILKK